MLPAFPEFAEAAAGVEEGLVLDGELVVFHGGRLDFAALQQRARRPHSGFRDEPFPGHRPVVRGRHQCPRRPQP